MTNYNYVGIDVAKDKFDIAFLLSDKYSHKCFKNDKKGYQSFLKWLHKNIPSPWICMEATGHYSELIADFLVAANVRVSIVNPLQIKSFARAKLSRNKNDIIDGKIILEYCRMMQPRTFEPRSTDQKELNDLIKLLDTLKDQLTRLRNQLHSTQGKIAKIQIKKLIKNLEKDINNIEKQIKSLIEDNIELHNKLRLMTSIKGIGALTAYKILAKIPNIHNFSSAKQFAAFIGLSPKQNQSGYFQGKTTLSRVGDSRLRKTFFMAAVVAKNHNEHLQPFVTRLANNGKAPKAIVGAIMRKLAHLIFGVLKNNLSFDPNYV
jgi:transposase